MLHAYTTLETKNFGGKLRRKIFLGIFGLYMVYWFIKKQKMTKYPHPPKKRLLFGKLGNKKFRRSSQFRRNKIRQKKNFGGKNSAKIFAENVSRLNF